MHGHWNRGNTTQFENVTALNEDFHDLFSSEKKVELVSELFVAFHRRLSREEIRAASAQEMLSLDMLSLPESVSKLAT